MARFSAPGESLPDRTQKILVRLLDERLDVWRPVSALLLGGSVFRLLGPCPADERLEFEPGQEVVGERRVIEGEQVLVATAHFVSGWSVWRQDDHGSRFEVRAGLTHLEARQLSSELEASPHKQSYWVEPTREPG